MLKLKAELKMNVSQKTSFSCAEAGNQADDLLSCLMLEIQIWQNQHVTELLSFFSLN